MSELFIHKDRPWLRKVLEASKDKYSLYLHGSECVKDDLTSFLESGKANIHPFDEKYEPIPYYYQYDLEIDIFLNYNLLKKREDMRVFRQIEKLKEEKHPNKDKLIELENRLEFVRKFGPTGLPRYEHLFNAAEIRWPTTEHNNGALTGAFVRDPWAIRRMEAVSDNNTFTIAFGGGGQGKTWTFLGFLLMIFEHYIMTRNGAKVSFSSINKDKINNVAWPHLQKLCTSTQDGISLYAGRSIISGDWTLRRPGKGKKDTGGVFKGILVGRHLNDSVVIDKLTGTHGHLAYGYLVDEAQNTPKAPIEASSNYLSTGRPAWIILAGNYDQDDDGLGPNCKPLNGGWETVTPETGKWTSETITGSKATVIHFNNELSPGMDDKLAKRFPHLPNRAKRDAIYPKGKCNLQNKGARRFWFGWRSTDIDENRVLTNQLVIDGQANLPLDLDRDYPISNFGSLDVAESGGDRNPFMHFQDGFEKGTEKWVWGPKEVFNIEAPHDPRKNQEVISNECVKLARKLDIDPDGCIIIDGTKNTGHAGKFYSKGYNVVSMIYHKALPDGKRTDKFTRKQELPILVNPNAPSDSGRFAHQLCYNTITFGAFLLKEYVCQGKVRGINDSLLKHFLSNRTLEEELFRRSFLSEKITTDYGDRYCLDSKEEFVDSYKFSPDILDTLFQAAYYMFVHRGMPLYDEVEEDDVKKSSNQLDRYRPDEQDLVSVHSEIWRDDDIDFLDENY